MTFSDDYRIQELMFGGVVNLVEAERMRRRGSLARETADMLLCDACMPPIGEGVTESVVARFESYAAVLKHNSEDLVLGDVNSPVREALRHALDGYTLENGEVRLRQLLCTLGSNSGTYRESALIVHTRVMASQIRDEVTHPYTGALMMGWPDLKPQDDLNRPEIEAIFESRRLAEQWINSGDRVVAEGHIVALASSVGWPP